VIVARASFDSSGDKKLMTQNRTLYPNELNLFRSKDECYMFYRTLKEKLGEAGLEEIVAVFKLPLLSGLFAGLQETQAFWSRVGRA
jgi:hypothetical protein